MRLYFFAISFLVFHYAFGQAFTCSDLPLVVVETTQSIPDEPKISGTMKVIYNGPGLMNCLDDPGTEYEGRIAIETRGNSTQDFEKKSYSLETRTISNQDSSVSFFGMGKDEDWILHAMVIDKSLLRIPMSFYLSQRTGQYASEWKYVELVLNGDYRGVYLLTERVKRDDDRVDIAKLEPSDLSGDAVTGGYILRFDWLHQGEGFESAFNSKGNQRLLFQYYYPRSDDIRGAQIEYIKDWMFQFESALFSPNFRNESGLSYQDYIDLDAFADFFIINEFSKNSDGYKLSTFIHKDRDSRGGKLKAGPIWDFDQTYGLSVVCSSHITSGWLYLQNQDACGDLESMPLWWERLRESRAFRDRTACRWETLRNGPMHKDSIFQWIDEHVILLNSARIRNFERWDVIGRRIWIEPDHFPGTYEEEIAYLKDWISDRLSWLDARMLAGQNDGNACDGVVTSTLHIEDSEPLFFPNPAQNRITINGPYSKLIIFNGLGKEVKSATNSLQEINLSDLTAGLYILSIDGRTHKMVIH